jgi:hypothetical protein
VKKLIALLVLAAVIVTGTVGCGGTPTTKAGTTPSTSTGTGTKAP